MAEKALSTRRQFLKAAPPALALAALPAAVVAEQMDAQARYHYHLAEFQKAAEELHPEIHWWQVQHAGGGCLLQIMGHQKKCSFEGDGWYSFWFGGRRMVRHAPERDTAAERWFLVEGPYIQSSYMPEREFEAKFLGLAERLDREAEACL